jgi:peptide deformylase
MNLIIEPNPILKQRAEEWDFETDTDAEVIERDMLNLMKTFRGLGLAANQVGLLKRVFVMKLQNGDEVGFFNPTVISTEGEQEGEEGCLSFPNLWLKIKRFNKLTASYLDNKGQERIIELTGLDARCFLHELDHLNGTTFTEEISPLKLALARKKQRKLNGRTK